GGPGGLRPPHGRARRGARAALVAPGGGRRLLLRRARGALPACSPEARKAVPRRRAAGSGGTDGRGRREPGARGMAPARVRPLTRRPPADPRGANARGEAGATGGGAPRLRPPATLARSPLARTGRGSMLDPCSSNSVTSP